MLKRSLLTTLAILIVTSCMTYTETSAADLPNSFRVGKSELTLNGSGVRKSGFFKLYTGGLYLPKQTTSAQAIIDANELMVITIEITSGFVSQEKMVAALNAGFQSATNGDTSSITREVEQFQACFADAITSGDRFNIAYLPTHGVVVTKNGSRKGVIEGLAFKKALFGIWLGDNPADQGLKNGMLGR